LKILDWLKYSTTKKEKKKENKGKDNLQAGHMERKNMLMPGKMTEIEREVRRYKTEILALQETRCPGKGKIDKKNYTTMNALFCPTDFPFSDYIFFNIKQQFQTNKK
jgi:hypothetical protein